ncbi:DUF7344 domain-containing protein [Halorussus marinus]|uniref:DUF7344 domain-containing protein n=1 Tax=Halorussus marinus TaxID=2505976 RepID=UPI001092B155|nr:hypothetical protein [Halorussus marinus]
MSENNKISDENRLSQLDRYLRALSDPERRQALYYLDKKETASSEELARQIAAQDSEDPSSPTPEDEWKSIQRKLHHQHLPQLRDYAIVDFDERNKDICLSDLPPLFTILLQFCRLVESE